ncbi:MAG: UDP-3-O-acyl-N-acetylglucosamine deacetylase [Pseudomonadota bacterium]
MRQTARLSGTGVHTGMAANISISPAPPGHGVRFVRVDAGASGADIKAHADQVLDVTLATSLSNGADSVATVEHLLAALYGLRIDNALIEIDGPEVPILDGSSVMFCESILAAGLAMQDAPKRVLRIVETVEVHLGKRWARLSPKSGDNLELCGRIEYENAVIGVQEASICLASDDFVSDVASARTFGLASEVDDLQRRGFARGGSLENAIVVDREGILNPEGLRYTDEFVRHKLLDAMGDLSLAGSRIAGRYEANQPGHRVNFELVKALLATPSAWRIDEPFAVNHGTVAEPTDIGIHASL